MLHSFIHRRDGKKLKLLAEVRRNSLVFLSIFLNVKFVTRANKRESVYHVGMARRLANDALETSQTDMYREVEMAIKRDY
jgi:hypothetical protein